MIVHVHMNSSDIWEWKKTCHANIYFQFIFNYRGQHTLQPLMQRGVRETSWRNHPRHWGPSWWVRHLGSTCSVSDVSLWRYWSQGRQKPLSKQSIGGASHCSLTMVCPSNALSPQSLNNLACGCPSNALFAQSACPSNAFFSVFLCQFCVPKSWLIISSRNLLGEITRLLGFIKL